MRLPFTVILVLLSSVLFAQPQFSAGTYLGGSQLDSITSVAVDEAGYIYVAGWTESIDLPTKNAAQFHSGGGVDAFVAKFLPAGTGLVYCTYLGGTGQDKAYGVAVDGSGNAYVTGSTNSTNFPMISAYQYRNGGAQNAFLVKLNGAGSIVYSTYFGGSGVDLATTIAVDSQGNAYIGGSTTSPNLPVHLPAQGALSGASDGFLLKMDPTGRTIVYCTYLGGASSDAVGALALDSAGAVYLTGNTQSSNFPIVGGYQTTISGAENAFVAKFSSSGQIVYSTFLGGSAGSSALPETGNAITVDNSGSAYVVGVTPSPDFPVTSPGGGKVYADSVFAAKISSSGSSLSYSVVVGGSGTDFATGVTFDNTGGVWICGYTSSTDFPLAPAISSTHPGYNAFVLDLSSQGVVESTAFVGGASSEAGLGVTALNGSLYMVGQTSSTNLVFANPVQTKFAGVMDGFLEIANPINAAITATPSGASVTVTGTGCSPGAYTTPVGLYWVPQAQCLVSFADPVVISNSAYSFESLTVNGSAYSHSNPIAVTAGSTIVSIAGAYSVDKGLGPGTVTHFMVTGPSNATAGIPVQFTVTALNASNQAVATFSDPIHFTTSDASAVVPADTVLVNGTGSFTASLVTTGTQWLAVSDLLSPAISGTGGSIAVVSPSGAQFVPIAPCRVVDTRNTTGPFGGPMIAGGTSRSFSIPNGPCGIPSTALAYSFNIAVVPSGPLSYLTVWPTGQLQPVAATLNSIDGRIKSNAAIIPAGSAGAISIYATNSTSVVLDINGYFVPSNTGGALAFYPITPCRLVDTRIDLLMTPLVEGTSQTLPVLSSQCGIPPIAQAYSFNFVAVTNSDVGYITAYPAGQTQPLAATLNDPTGTLVANAAIVPAGSGGSISVYSTNNTDLVVDINGYFAPPGTGGLSLYTLPPCRVLDTRMPPVSASFTGQFDVNVLGSGCGATPSAQAYVFNATVVPPGPLSYLTLWPQGIALPLAATLNATDGFITNNMAIVPTLNVEISAWATNPTQLILDIFGYFAP